jgi:hypothetical protein
LKTWPRFSPFSLSLSMPSAVLCICDEEKVM